MIKARHTNINVSQRRETINHKNQQVGDLYLEAYWETWGKTGRSWKRLPRVRTRPLAVDHGGKKPKPKQNNTTTPKPHNHITESTYIFTEGQFKYYKRMENCK